MSIHPQIRQVLENMAALELPPYHSLSPADAREQYNALARTRTGISTPSVEIRASAIPGPAGDIPIQIYTPADATGPLPLLIYFPGGGFVIGNPQTHDAATRHLCAGAQCKVISVDYRKAPEHPFPAAVNDSYSVLEWCANNADSIGIDPMRIAVGGDSAGGALAAVTALQARDHSGPAICFQLLIYPCTDSRCLFDSHRRFAHGCGLLDADTAQWFMRNYFSNPAEVSDWRGSPLLAEDLSGLPPALLMTAEYDILHDEGKAYAEALQATGNEVTYQDYTGMIHGFFLMVPQVDAALEAQRAAIQALCQAFA